MRDITDFSDAQQKATTYSDESITKAQTALLRFGRVSGDVFDRARKDILDVAAALGTDLESAAFSVGRALQSPTQGLRQLRALGIIFTEAQQKLIKSLEDTGQVAKAQAIILEALENRFGGAAEAARNTLGGALQGLENAFGDLFEATDKGASSATEAINGLADTLSDPAIKSALQDVAGFLLTTFGELVKIAALAIDGWKQIGKLAAEAAQIVPSSKLDELFEKQSNLGALLNNALEEQSVLRTNQVDPMRQRQVAREIEDLRARIKAVDDELNGVRQGQGGPQPVGSRQRTAPGGVKFISDEQVQQENEDARLRAEAEWKKAVEAQAEVAKRHKELSDLLNSFGERQGREALEQVTRTQALLEETTQKSIENIGKVLEPNKKAIDEIVGTATQGLENLARSGQLTGKSIARYLISAFESKAITKAIDALGKYLSNALSSASTSGSGFGSFLSGIFSAFGHAAGGGRMSGPRIVGEDGPELDMGGGNILNRRQLAFAGGGGGDISIGPTTIVVQGTSDPATTAQYVEARISTNNRKLLEQVNRLMKDNYGRSLR